MKSNQMEPVIILKEKIGEELSVFMSDQKFLFLLRRFNTNPN